MPVHVASVSRREFLTRTAAAFAGVSLIRISQAAPEDGVWKLALLSDTHIAADPATMGRGINMVSHLQQAVREVNALASRPQAVIFNGDCAYLHGKKEDYATFAQCVEPLMSAGQTVHMTMGNHDERETFYETFRSQRPEQPAVISRHVSLIETPHANLFLLDSLKQVNVVTGELGEAQRTWLAQILDAHADKPAVLMAHHTLQLTPPPEGKAWGGIADTAEFLDLIRARKHVKAYVFGHSHRWSQTREGDLNLINLPAVAYVFDQKQPSGWTLAQITPQGMEFQLHALDPAHPQHHQVFRFDW